MNRLKITFMLVIAIILCLATSCKKNHTYAGRSHNIVVFHSWADKGEEGEPFRQLMADIFEDYNVRANIHHVYLDMIHYQAEDIDREKWASISDSLKQWEPEIILINDDPALNWALQGKHDEVFNKIPIIFAGINNLNEQYLQDYMNITGFVDEIDIDRNIEMMRTLIGCNTVIVELDNIANDKKTQNKILKDIEFNYNDYVNNSDFHLERYNDSYVDSVAPNKKCIMFVSCQNPAIGPYKGTSNKIDDTKLLIENSHLYNYLQVKYDIYSNILQESSNKPMFSCIREQFNNPEELHVIGGYFTSMETQVFEQVQYANEILENNLKPSMMPVSSHDKKYLIDYNAIPSYLSDNKNILGFEGIKRLVIDGWGEKYYIINAPFFLNNRTSWLIGTALFIIVLSFLITWLTKRIHKRIQAKREELTRNVQDELNLRRHILANVDSTVWKSSHRVIEFQTDFAKKHGIKKKMPLTEFQKGIHPDSLSEWYKLVNFHTDLGRRRIRVLLELKPGTGHHWFDIIYNVTTESSYNWELSGLAICTDNVVMQKQQLIDAIEEAKEIKLKNKFLSNFKFILSTPLQIIVSNARKVIDYKSNPTPEQIAHYTELLHGGATELINNIDSLVEDIQAEEVADKQARISQNANKPSFEI